MPARCADWVNSEYLDQADCPNSSRQLSAGLRPTGREYLKIRFEHYAEK